MEKSLKYEIGNWSTGMIPDTDQLSRRYFLRMGLLGILYVIM